MPYRPKSAAQSFDSSWQQTVAWAQGQGISMNSILPVYQLDYTRLQNGEYPMGRAERNLSVLAAHNPNQVSSSPADNPRPSNIWGNVVGDAGKIATGIEGIFTGSFEKQVWDSAKTTFEAVIHPASLDAPTLGGTIGNWLNDTLLSYLPGAADIGTVLQKDPSLTGGKGFLALAQHPLLSILDLVPGEGGLAERAARAVGAGEIAARMAARGGDRSAFAEIAHQVASVTAGGKPGVNLHGQLMAKLNVNDRIQNALANAGKGSWGVGPAISRLSEAAQTSAAMEADLYTWLLDKPTQELKAIQDDPRAMEYVKKVFDTYRTTGGDSVREALADPTVSPAIKSVIKDWTNGPLRFATEEELFAGGIRPKVGLDGEVGMWAPTGKSASKVFHADRLRTIAQVQALEKLPELDRLAGRTNVLNAMLPKAVGQFTGALSKARREVFDDPALQRPLTRELGRPSRTRQAAGISRTDQLHAVVGEGGLADQFLEQIRRNRDPDQIEALAKAMKSRLSAWGPRSVNAADHPALAELRQTAEAFERWARVYRRNANAVDRAIYGTEKSRAEHMTQHLEHRAHQRSMLKARQTRAGESLLETYRTAKNKHAGELQGVINRETEGTTWQLELLHRETESAGARATDAEVTRMVKAERIKARELRQGAAERIKAARAKMARDNRQSWTEYQRDRAKLTAKNKAELAKFDKQVAGERVGMGEELAAVTRLGRAVRTFHSVVADTPADQYKNVYRALMEQHMTAQLDTSALAQATDQYLRNIPEMTEKRLSEISSDPSVLTEYAMTYFDEIMRQPDLDPELGADARDEYRQYSEDAREEVKQLIGEGLRITYVPSATAFDERLGRNSMAPIIGHGIPKPDMAKAKVWDFTPHKEDFALGINKSVVQALQRDATIHFIEDTLRPMTLTRKQVADFAAAVLKPEERAFGGNLPHELALIANEKLGLTKVDFTRMFNVGLPRWAHDETYLPTPMVRALDQLEKDRKSSGVLRTGNKVFRYSILGLSPRYTAHILFGGTMMLALRSSPYALGMIRQAARAMRDGTIPHGIARHAVEEGFEEPVNMVQTQVGRDLGKMAIGEHIEQVQKVKAAAAKPVHVLRALADINFRFTRYLRDLQASVAYLDGAAKYERSHGGKVMVEDPETGRMIHVTPERAMKEGMHHVQQVFGNLHRMSPFERQVAQTVMPFYGWQKHILGYVMSFPFDHPWRALILSQLAFNASNQVPLAYPIRIQLLMPLGTPDSQGNVNAIDIRSLDPFRDVSNYGTLTGFFESLNPALSAPLSMAFGSQAIYGESSLYPNVTYNAFYGIQTATSGGSWVNALEQWVPQAGAVVSALQASSGVRSEWDTNRSAAIKTLLESMNVPFVTPPINLKQIAAKDEAARFESASKAAYNAFSSGDFSGLAGYKTVPYPLNTAYEVTPAQLEALYQQSLQQNPGIAPIEALIPPQTPYGW